MVLVPFSSISQKTPAQDDDEIDFSKHSDTPFMAHIKIEMKKILGDNSLSMREKLRLYNPLLRKYQIAKENHLKETRRKNPNNFPAPAADILAEEVIIPEEEEEEQFWWDGEMPSETTIGATHGLHNQEPRELHEITDDEEEMSVDSEMVPGTSRPNTDALRSQAKKRNFEEIYDPFEELLSAPTRGKVLRARRRNAVDSPPAAHIQRRRNAVDTPPNAQVRLRETLPRVEVLRKRITPSELVTFVDHRFKKNTRKRAASKITSGKKGWLGRRRMYYTPPASKQRKLDRTDSDDGTSGKPKWSRLSK